MPIGPYADFAACVAAQKRRGKSDIAARKICGSIEQNVKKHHKNMSAEELEACLSDAENLFSMDEELSTEAAIRLASRE